MGATALFTGADVPAAAEDAPSEPTVQHVVVASFDGTPVALTVFRPVGASEAHPVPLVLHGHGWSGSRTRDLGGGGIVDRLVAAGYGVVSVDARGHGESGGLATVHHKDHEVKDFQAVLDWAHDTLPWVLKEPESGIPKDVVAGAAGYSYGGGFQLMLASHDGRLDAVAPEITWSHLPDALAPQGALKSMWVHALVVQAKQSGTRLDPRVEAWYREAMLTNALPPEALAHFEGSSPALDEIDAHVLLIQGVPDVLFNLNQAVRTYQALEAGGRSDVRLFTHLSGHVVPAQPLGTGADRRMPYEDAGPCGAVMDAVVAWMDEHLRGLGPSGIPEVSFALDDGGCVRLDAYPTATLDVAAPLVPAPSAAGSLLVPLGEGPMVVAGVPHLRANVSAAAAEGRAHAGLVVVGADGFARVLDDQTQPVPLAPGRAVDLDLVGVAARLGEGDRLFLRVDGLNEWYATNGWRSPGAALLTDVVVTLPVVA